MVTQQWAPLLRCHGNALVCSNELCVSRQRVVMVTRQRNIYNIVRFNSLINLLINFRVKYNNIIFVYVI